MRIDSINEDYQALQEELENRYGPAIAQDLIDEIVKVEQSDQAPGYMIVKALSECVEEFKPEPDEQPSVTYQESQRLFYQFYRRAMRPYEGKNEETGYNRSSISKAA